MRNLAQAKIPEWIYIRNCANKLHLRVFSTQYYVNVLAVHAHSRPKLHNEFSAQATLNLKNQFIIN